LKTCQEATKAGYREDWARSRNDAVRRGASKGPQGRNRGDAGRRTEKAA
jgi:hypothetical protein